MRVPNHNSFPVTFGQGLKAVSLPQQKSQAGILTLTVSSTQLFLLLIGLSCCLLYLGISLLFWNSFGVLFVFFCLLIKVMQPCQVSFRLTCFNAYNTGTHFAACTFFVIMPIYCKL